MTKKHFIALADAIKAHNEYGKNGGVAAYIPSQVMTLADFCAEQNPNFNRGRWLGYIAGDNGPSGGRKKREKPLPPCVIAMGCYCAGHARGLKASAPCDTTE